MSCAICCLPIALSVFAVCLSESYRSYRLREWDNEIEAETSAGPSIRRRQTSTSEHIVQLHPAEPKNYARKKPSYSVLDTVTSLQFGKRKASICNSSLYSNVSKYAEGDCPSDGCGCRLGCPCSFYQHCYVNGWFFEYDDFSKQVGRCDVSMGLLALYWVLDLFVLVYVCKKWYF
eukprot:TRINITY_DN24184_c0_g1_i2.p1 TRINITY_DN24184_c0_g1~~TRINITY_DN24184_c0_g1_i2.p1  ORF type:complete len:190 (+),score=15.39 TRINITY_DN24184_c0_g1_i2:48-572(+)